MASKREWTLELSGRRRFRSAHLGGQPKGELDDLVQVRERVDKVEGKDQHQAFRMDGSSRGGNAVETVKATGSDIVEVDLGSGLLWWTTVDELARAAEGPAERSSEDRVLEVTDESGRLRLTGALGGGGSERGLGQVAMQGLRLLDIELPAAAQFAGEQLAMHIAHKLEERLQLGLWRCPDATIGGSPVVDAKDLPTSKPLVLFLHGTASSFESSFSDMVDDSIWPALRRHYGDDAILAFEHRTFTHSPLRNAIELIELLPADATLHLVSHSRGGLIGELLCRGRMVDGESSFDDRDFELIDRQHSEDLRTLDALLQQKRPKVERFVRVACPARGTTLVSDRMDRTMSLALGAMGLVPQLANSISYELLKAMLLTLLQTRTSPDKLPGLEAMRPTSRFVAMLQRTDRRVDANLTVVAGDIESSGIFKRLLVMGADLFFRGDHDLVVDTSSMYGGTPRRSGQSRASFERSSETHHFSYFQRRRNTIFQALTGRSLSSQEQTDFEALTMGRAPAVRRGLLRSPDEVSGDRPVVVVLPGVMGSRLSSGGNVIWLDVDDLMFGGMRELADGKPVTTAGLIASTYESLVEHLSTRYQVVPVPFDWRLSLEDQARVLLDTLEKVAQVEQPIRVVAHSMGGLLALTSTLPELDVNKVWDKLQQRSGFRLLMLGTPCRGSHVIPAIVFAREKLVRWLHRMDGVLSRNEVLAIINGFQGLYDMLPAYLNSDQETDESIFDVAEWEKWRDWDKDDWPLPQPARLARAHRLRGRLNEVLDGLVERFGKNSVVYVAGQADETPNAVQQRSKKWWRKSQLDLRATGAGDGRVTWQDGPPPHVPVWYVEAKHGALPKFEKAWPGYLELLENGDTLLLDRVPPQVSPQVRGGQAGDMPYTEYEVGTFPTAEDLVAAALGDDVDPPAPSGRHPLRASVVHGDLRFATERVLVGHYQDDGLFSAEAALDSILDGALGRLHGLDLYPGPEGSWEIIEHSNDRGQGAVIVGLGPVGELDPGRLERVVRLAAMRHALHFQAANGVTEPARVGLSAVLIGSGDGSGMTIEDSVRQIVSGVRFANRQLERAQGDVCIDRLELIELFEDRAIRAARALRKLGQEGGSSTGGDSQPLVASAELHWVDGGLHRLYPNQNDGWWRRLQIAVASQPADESIHDRPLVFTYLSDRARAPQQTVATQRRLAEEFIEEAVNTAAWNSQAAATLFEMLVPRAFKEYAPSQQDLVLIVDEEAASYPWELMEDAISGSGTPVAVRAGMVRQLKTPQFRHQVHHPANRRALVIGDPPSELPALDGALAEARLVAELLRAWGWEVDFLERPSPGDVLQHLFIKAYQLVHIAGHGVLDSPSGRGGLVIGPGKVLTPGDLDQMRRVPQFFFVNCCHLGKMDGSDEARARGRRSHLAASIGGQLIRMGVRAVVAAGWAVDDAAAATFAEVLYQEVQDNSPFGLAVKNARSRTYYEHRYVNTWGAYQCYGDPSFQLDRDGGGGAAKRFRPVAPKEVVYELHGLASRSRVGGDIGWLAKRIRDIENLLRDRHLLWLELADVQGAFGEAFSELAELQNLPEMVFDPASDSAQADISGVDRFGAFEQAIEYLEKALSSDRGSIPMNVPRHLARLLMRRAIFEWRYPSKQPRESQAQPSESARSRSMEELASERRQSASRKIDKVAGDLKQLAKVDGSIWVQIALGDVYRKSAQLSRSDSACLGDLMRAANYFGHGHERAQASKLFVGVYPAVGWHSTRLVGALIFHSAYDKVASGTAEFWQHMQIDDLVAWLHAPLGEGRKARTFWQKAALGDKELCHLMWRALGSKVTLDELRGELELHSVRVVEHYLAAFKIGGSPRQRATKLEELDWLSDVLNQPGTEPSRALRVAEERATPVEGPDSNNQRRMLVRSLARRVRRRLAAQIND